MLIRDGRPWLSERELEAFVLTGAVLHRLRKLSGPAWQFSLATVLTDMHELLRQCAVSSSIPTEYVSLKKMLEVLGQVEEVGVGELDWMD